VISAITGNCPHAKAGPGSSPPYSRFRFYSLFKRQNFRHDTPNRGFRPLKAQPNPAGYRSSPVNHFLPGIGLAQIPCSMLQPDRRKSWVRRLVSRNETEQSAEIRF